MKEYCLISVVKPKCIAKLTITRYQYDEMTDKQIEKVISSLLTIMFPQEELSFTNKVQEKFTKMFNEELGDDGDDNLTSSGFSKKYIWRRYHKK